MKIHTRNLAIVIVVVATACHFVAPARAVEQEPNKPSPAYDAVQRQIVVDGKTNDWDGVCENVVRGEEHLWFGQGMTRQKWHGDTDHSYKWSAAWYDNKLYFLFDVTDDRLVDPPGQPNSFLKFVQLAGNDDLVGRLHDAATVALKLPAQTRVGRFDSKRIRKIFTFQVVNNSARNRRALFRAGKRRGNDDDEHQPPKEN